MAEKVQSYRNHPRLLPPFHFFVLPMLALNVVVAGRRLYFAQDRHFAWEFVVALALVTLAFLSRTQALRAQDRTIRLEMRLRLYELLSGDTKTRINDLTPRQLIALRFASDEELPGIVSDVLAGKLSTSKEIKMRVKNWQADWLRV